jgi:predicted helicase
VLSERRRHLTDIFEYVREQTGHISAYYLGGMKQRDLDESTGNRVILATMSMAQEALDIPSLNTLILATSKGNVIQAVGRVLRRMNPDCYPWIIDIADVFSVFRNQMMRRIKYYKQMQFRVVTHHFNESSGSGPGQGQSIDLMRTTDDGAAAAASASDDDDDGDGDDESDTDPYADDFR